MLTLLLISACVFTFFFHHFYWKRRNLPPGPLPLPLIGNLGSLSPACPRYDKFLEWQKSYGNVFTFWFSELPFVMVCDYKLIHEAFVKKYPDQLAGRKSFEQLNDTIRGGTYGIIDTSGELWREQRRFSLQVLRDFGLGKNLMEQKILDEVDAMLREVKKDENSGGICDVTGRFDVCVGSIINNMIFGYRFEGESLKDFTRLRKMMHDLFLHINTPANLILALYYWMRHLPFFKNVAKKSADMTADIFEYLDEQIEKHEQHFTDEDLENSESVDFCEEYLKQIQKQQKLGTAGSHFSKIQLRNVCMDLWVAGLETTSTTCQFAVIYLLNHPEVYKKVKNEMASNTKLDQLLTMNDKPQLPYFQAFLNEAQRMTNILLINLFHQATDDVVIDGYPIKKGTIVIPQISNVMFDEKIFPDPFKFDPSRFLDECGKVKKVEELVPFSIGKRQCLGEGLARMELFLILANLIKNFDLLPEKDTPPSMDKKWGVTVQPIPFKIRVQSKV